MPNASSMSTATSGTGTLSQRSMLIPNGRATDARGRVGV
jgi:hypothetical protein